MTQYFSTSLGAGGMTITLIAIALSGCNYQVVIALWLLNGALSCGSSLSYLVSVIDFAPNYAGEKSSQFKS